VKSSAENPVAPSARILKPPISAVARWIPTKFPAVPLPLSSVVSGSPLNAKLVSAAISSTLPREGFNQKPTFDTFVGKNTSINALLLNFVVKSKSTGPSTVGADFASPEMPPDSEYNAGAFVPGVPPTENCTPGIWLNRKASAETGSPAV
jgi:hypothetical protein